jgi:MFS family permease
VAFLSYASTAFAPVYAQEVLGVSTAKTGAWIGGFGALGGFLGVILGGRMSDTLRQTNPAGRIAVIAFGLLAPVLPLWFAFSTVPTPGDSDFIRFVALASLTNMLASSALGAAAATTQDLVLPRMRGTATATFLIAATLFGLALGPYLAGYVSATTHDLGIGVKSILVIVPIGLTLLAFAYRLVPTAEATLVQRARAAGEVIA